MGAGALASSSRFPPSLWGSLHRRCRASRPDRARTSAGQSPAAERRSGGLDEADGSKLRATGREAAFRHRSETATLQDEHGHAADALHRAANSTRWSFPVASIDGDRDPRGRRSAGRQTWALRIRAGSARGSRSGWRPVRLRFSGWPALHCSGVSRAGPRQTLRQVRQPRSMEYSLALSCAQSFARKEMLRGNAYQGENCCQEASPCCEAG